MLWSGEARDPKRWHGPRGSATGRGLGSWVLLGSRGTCGTGVWGGAGRCGGWAPSSGWAMAGWTSGSAGSGCAADRQRRMAAGGGGALEAAGLTQLIHEYAQVA
jgi:hypothetical protein